MLSFFGDQCFRDAVVELAREYQRLDQIIQGQYWKQCDDGIWRGCSIGCILHSSDHMAYEQHLGLPVFLAYMNEHIFESLPKDEAKFWPLRFIEAVPVGVNLELVFPRFMHWLLSDPQGLRQYANARTLPIFETMAHQYAARIDGVPFDRDTVTSTLVAVEAEWTATRSAEAAMRAAMWTAMRSAMWAAMRAADAAMWAAEDATRSAAAARRAAARTATKVARNAAIAAEAAGDAVIHLHRQADYLISLLQSYESMPIHTEQSPCVERYAFLQQPM
jgi:hypothetical protein